MNDSYQPPPRPAQQLNGYRPRLYDPFGNNDVPQFVPQNKNGKAADPDVSSIEQKRDLLSSVIKRAQKGDASALPELRRLLAEFPVEKIGGDLSNTLVQKMLDSQFEDDLHAKELVLLKLAELRSTLGGPKPTPVEMLLIERIVCSWLRLHLAEITASIGEFGSDSLSNVASRSHDRLHKQYLSSLKALADLRRLNVTIQLCVAKRQALTKKSEQDYL